MTTAPFQVLVFPYRFTPSTGFEYAVFKRADLRVLAGHLRRREGRGDALRGG